MMSLATVRSRLNLSLLNMFSPQSAARSLSSSVAAAMLLTVAVDMPSAAANEAAAASAVTTAVAAADSCTVPAFQQLQAVGKTRLKVWFWDVYDAQLRTDTGAFSDANQRALQLTYLRDIDADDLVDTTADEWQRLGIEQTPEHQQWLQQLREMWPNVSKGDCITLVETNAGDAQFYANQELLGEIASAQFTDDFLAIWLDAKSRFKDERDELIGAK
ncbi:chalcone isomerase family protein [Pseudidiomarina sp. WS423]|uniref:chalcone isomerase family protein n=1 Tax=Pseudidiomarina sp. WS423 TaxID=3425124 RepID=UPI003D6E9854